MSSKKQIKGEGFLHFKLCDELFRGIARKGYSCPTPIQNKTIPLIISGRNVVAMAPTGSGKTAAYLIPMFEKLKNPFCGDLQSSSNGPRALIISPTRELALQIVKFAEEIGRFMSVKAALLLGGESMDEDFRAIHENPDIIIATPARLLHIQVEMGARFNLSNIEYVVFDEGDRLFELGMVEQLTETFNRLPKSRQTVIFSATLPGNLVDFARAGLDNPKLVRLDLNHRLSEKLKLNFIYCSNDNKLAVLIELLTRIKNRDEQIIVFFASKHHIEFVSKVLTNFSLDHVIVYSSLDPEARRLNAETFYKNQSKIMLTTDIAARGIDIPQLANMMNFHFADKPKLFQHRVGRVARAGEAGTAYSLIDNMELPYVMDTFIYLSKPFKMIDTDLEIETVQTHGFIGAVPQSIINEHTEAIESIIKNDCEIEGLRETSVRSLGKYNRTKKLASSESVKRCRQFIEAIDSMKCHPLFSYADNMTDIQHQFRQILKQSRPRQTIFETTHGRSETACNALSNLRKMKEIKESIRVKTKIIDEDDFRSSKCPKSEPGNYMVPNLSGPDASEVGLNLQNSGFAQEAKEAVLELQNDENQSTIRAVGAKRQRMMWDRKRKKFVQDKSNSNTKKIRTESGAVISASYKTNAYDKWLKTSNTGMIAAKTVSFEDDENETQENPRNWKMKNKAEGQSKNQNRKSFQMLNTGSGRFKNQPNRPMIKDVNRNVRELRPEQALKKMKQKQKVKDFQKKREKMNKRSK